MTRFPDLSRREFLGAGGALMAFASGLGPRDARAAMALYGGTREAAAAAVKEILQQKDIPSLSYALIGRDGVIFADAAGIVDAGGQAPSTDTLYCIGSRSKVVAVTAMMRLIDQGGAGLDDPLTKYLPEFRMLSDGYRDITLRMLMCHASGLPGSDYRGLMTTAWNGAYAEQVLATAASSRLKHRPGEMSVYCNDGFTLLEPVIRAITGVSFAEHVEKELLAPLGMALSGYGNRAAATDSFAPGIDGTRMLPREFLNAAASGGLYTTPSEMARFLGLFLNDGRSGEFTVLSPAAVAAMGENQTARQPFLPLPATDGFGLGWDGVNPPAFAALGLKAWRKNGGTAVYASDMIVLPELGLAVLATGAAPAFPAGKLTELILFNALAENGTLKEVPKPLAGVAAPATGAPVPEAWFSGVFGNYEQVFRMEPDGKGGAVQFKADAGQWRRHGEAFTLREDGAIASDAAKAVSLGLRDYEGFTFVTGHATPGYGATAATYMGGQKLKPLPPVTAAWQRRLGKDHLLVNVPPDSFLPGVQRMTVRLDAYPEIPGYAVFNFAAGSDVINQPVDASADDMRALMCLKIPVSPGRDLNDVAVLPKGGEDWLLYGSWLARPREGVPALGRGAREVAIGPEGHGEWFSLAEAGWLDIRGATDWMVFDDGLSMLASGKGDATGLSAMATAYVLVYGAAGARIGLTLARQG